MTEISEHFAKVAGEFTRRAIAVPADAWDNPAPCDGWVARDVVHAHIANTLYVDVDDPGILTDIDNLERYQNLEKGVQ